MLPGFDTLLSGGPGSSFNLPTSADGRTGAIRFGAFTFSPKSSALPPLAWVAIAAGALAVAAMVRRR